MHKTDAPGDINGPYGVMLNPGSGRVRKHLKQIRNLVAAPSPDALYEVHDLAEINIAVDEILNRGLTLLVIIGGDGTVQAALSRIFSSSAAIRPRIVIIPGGTTNMTAKDIGIHCSPLRALHRFNEQRLKQRKLNHVKRPVLEVYQTDQSTHYGMFFGVGMIASGARYFQTHIRKTGITGEFASFIVIINYLLRLIRGKYRSTLGLVTIDSTESDRSSLKVKPLLLFASTLDRLLFGLNPYWGAAAEPIHFTCIRDGASRFWRSMLAIVLRRGENLAEADGYYSQNIGKMELLMDGDFLIDGELFNVDSRHGPLHISATKPLTFLVL